MTDKYEKEFPLSGPLTFPGRIDKKLAEVFDRTTGTGFGTGAGGSVNVPAIIDEYVKKMGSDQAGALAQKLASYTNSVSILVAVSLKDPQVSQFVNNLINQLLASKQLRDAVNGFVKNYIDSQNSGTGTNTNETQQPTNNGTASN